MSYRNVFIGILVLGLVGCGGYEEQEDWYDLSGTITGKDGKTDKLMNVPFEIDRNNLQQRLVQVWQSGQVSGQVHMRYESISGTWNGYGATQGEQKLVITTNVFLMNTQRPFVVEIGKQHWYDNFNPWQWHAPRLMVGYRVNGGPPQKLPVYAQKVSWNPATKTLKYTGYDDSGALHQNREMPLFGYYNGYGSQFTDVKIFLAPVAWSEPGQFSSSRTYSMDITLDQLDNGFNDQTQNPNWIEGQSGYGGGMLGQKCNYYDPNACGGTGLACRWQNDGYYCVNP
jgi:hypothetical protein